MGRCLCFAPLLDKQASAKKSGKSLKERSPDKAGSIWKVVPYCIIIVSLCIMWGGTFQPQKRDLRSENRIAVLPTA